MTRNATRFLQPLTLAALTGHDVLIDELETPSPEIPHIAWARWADLVVVAPATANFLARVAHGMADDPLTCLLLALDPGKPVVVAPAMNTRMWENPLVQRNVAALREIEGGRFRFVDPASKRLACGEEGLGGLAPTDAIVAATVAALA
jgi:phosphopantothenoylcysteine synthetase/decarboxylase